MYRIVTEPKPKCRRDYREFTAKEKPMHSASVFDMGHQGLEPGTNRL